MSSWHSYPKIFGIEHRAVRPLLGRKVNLEEKVDGSQFSFGLINGVLRARSKNQDVHWDTEGIATEKMFSHAVRVIRELEPLLHPEWTYRGEYLQKEHHNALTYARIPKNHIIIFDINDGEESYLRYDEKKAEAERIGLECVPLIGEGLLSNPDDVKELLDEISVLGGPKIEGFVIKPTKYDLYGEDKKVIMGPRCSGSARPCWHPL
jgi:hypothetical protein